MIRDDKFAIAPDNRLTTCCGRSFTHLVKPRIASRHNRAESLLGHVPQFGHSLSAEVVENFVEK
jgi:hypothetical protein